MSKPVEPARTLPAWLGPLVVALAALLAVSSTLGDPGLTCDEFYDVQAGKSLVAAWRAQGVDFFRAESVNKNFGRLTPHPPLGRWLLGWTHHAFDELPAEPYSVFVVVARMAPAIAYAALVFLVGLATTRVAGTVGGISAAVAVAISPRVFGDAHFATLDTFTALGQFAAILALAKAVESGARPWHFALAGVVWGLALATKFHGMILGPIGIVWLVWQLRSRAWLPIVIWGACGGLVFVAAWPWLWYSPIERLLAYLSTATERQRLHVFYLGEVWRDVDAPWHYASVMFLVTLPIGLLLLGGVGLWSAGKRWWREPRLSIVAFTFLFVLGVFSFSQAPVYDGVRLFLVLFPLWAVAVGVGAEWLFHHSRLARWPQGVRIAALAIFLAAQGVGIVLYHPLQLSYYSALVGGLRGAESLGLETTYWGDSVTGELLDSAIEHAPGERVLYAPHLAPFQAASVEVSHGGFAESGVTLVGWDPTHLADAKGSRFALVYRRRADLATVEPILAGAKVIAETSRQGVWLARLYELPAPVEKLAPTTSRP